MDPYRDNIDARCAWAFGSVVQSYLEEQEELPGLLQELGSPCDRSRTGAVCIVVRISLGGYVRLQYQ